MANIQREMMELAINNAKRAGTPFGAVITVGDEPVVTAVNTTKKDSDLTAHAEMNAIRDLCSLTQNRSFPGYRLYTTCEPCPMCAGAIAWANLEAVYYGASIEDAAKYMPQIRVSCSHIFTNCMGDIHVESGVLRDQCIALFKK